MRCRTRRASIWAPSPIFLHERGCPRFTAAEEIAPIVLANGMISVRSYDTAAMCLYELGAVGEGREVAPLLDRALADPRTRWINIHTARPGCLLTAVERL